MILHLPQKWKCSIAQESTLERFELGRLPIFGSGWVHKKQSEPSKNTHTREMSYLSRCDRQESSNKQFPLPKKVKVSGGKICGTGGNKWIRLVLQTPLPNKGQVI
jgi:hypothetical protein